MAARGAHRQGARSGRELRAHFQGPLLPRTAGQPPARAAQRRAARDRPHRRPAAGRHQRLPLPASRRRARPRSPALHPDRQDARRRIAMALRHRRALRQDAGRDGQGVRRRVRRVPQHDGDRAAGRFRIRVRQVPFPDLPGRAARRSRPGAGSARDGGAGSAACGVARAPRRIRRGALLRASRPRVAGHPRDGLFGLHADRRRLHRLRAQPGHPGRTGPRLGGRQPGLLRAQDNRGRSDRAQAPVRALAQSGTQVDARYRRRLLLRAARRSAELRAREIRRRPRRADHHLRHHQGKTGHPRRRPRARAVLRRDRPHRQALSRAQAGPRFPAERRARDGAAAEGRARQPSRALRVRLQARRAAAPRLAPRGRRGHLRRSAGRGRPALRRQGTHRRRDGDHAVLDEGGRGNRTNQVRLPRAQEPDPDSRDAQPGARRRQGSRRT